MCCNTPFEPIEPSEPALPLSSPIKERAAHGLTLNPEV